MSKKVFSTLLIVMMALCLFMASDASAGENPIVLKFGHVSSTETPSHYSAVVYANEVARLTNGAVVVEIYPTALLGNERELIEGCALETTDLALVNTAMLEAFIPDFAVMNFPYMFSSEEHANRVINGEVGNYLAKRAADQLDFHMVGWTNLGFRQVISSRPINAVADLKGIKIRTMQTPLQLRLFESLGSIAVPLPASEQTIALQQGTVDAVDNSPIWSLANGWYEIAPYVAFTNHNFSFMPVGISTVALEKVPEKYRSALFEAGKVMQNDQSRIVNGENKKALVELKKKNGVFAELNMNELRALTDPLKKEFAKNLNPDLLKKIDELR